jgi:hypothetical protein
MNIRDLVVDHVGEEINRDRTDIATFAMYAGFPMILTKVRRHHQS